MNYVVTARKYRPQTFDEVVGQEHITKTLKNAIITNRIAHAYIFAGPRGVGKTSTARILAKSLNCLNRKSDGEPCNECEMCKAFSNSQSLDIIEIDGASNRRIEEIRQLRESVKYAPTKGSYKVYIIDEVHMLTTESFNALLKTLEEPPEHTIFIFATTDIHKVPLTIISRCQRFDFRRIELSTIKNALKKIAVSEGVSIDDTALTLIAKKSDGALRDAQSLFDQIISFSGNNIDSSILSKMLNLIDEDVYFAVSNAILDKNFNAAFEITHKLYENGWNFTDFINGLIEHFRNILTVIVKKDNNLIEAADVIKEKYLSYIGKFSESDILRILSFLNKTQWELKSSSNQKIKIEISLAHLIGLEKSATISEILNKIGNEKITRAQEANDLNSPSYSTKKKINSISNVTSVKKEEIKLPEVTSFIPPYSSVDSDFQKIIDKWQEFVEQVKTEKIFFGSVLVNSNPIKLVDNKLSITVEHPDDGGIIEENKSYLDKKTKEVFGKKIELHVKLDGDKTHQKETDSTQQNTVDESSIISAIINDLGGKEIK
ncbi:DNA polymerase III subunit gamma/tau [Melioribacteraceae bacterium 4301-Me]|uniref:DNA polymerase III subunit gamma/tau n=1 Tax=Pyranulibacter aquaticus TaxID=3163344 RepID=UPI0035982449